MGMRDGMTTQRVTEETLTFIVYTFTFMPQARVDFNVHAEQ